MEFATQGGRAKIDPNIRSLKTAGRTCGNWTCKSLGHITKMLKTFNGDQEYLLSPTGPRSSLNRIVGPEVSEKTTSESRAKDYQESPVLKTMARKWGN